MTILVRNLFLGKQFLTSAIKPEYYLHKGYAQARLVINMNEAFLKYDQDNDEVNISFRYIHKNINLDRQYNFRRRVDETVNNFLHKIDSNLWMHTMKVTKRRKKLAMEEIPKEDNVENNKIKLLQNDNVVSGDITLKMILQDEADLKLILFDTEYVVKRNAPSIDSIALPNSILVGFPTYPSKFESCYLDKEKSEFYWYKCSLSELHKCKSWIQVGRGYVYFPEVSDIGYKLKLTCLPRNDKQSGAAVEIVSNYVVEDGPGTCLFDSRHTFTKEKLSDKRIVSYNILADAYAETDYSKDVLYPFCPPYALTIDYRKLLILKELIGFNADIICLQETDEKVYDRDLQPILSSLNYDSVHNTKNELREGLAIFYNLERFQKLSNECSIMSQGTDLGQFDAVWSQIKNEKAKERFLKRNTVIQVVTLQSKEHPSEILIVGNTHLFFHPDADHIRLLQGYYAITFLQKRLEEVKRENPNCNVNVLFCGDFNSVPECGIYQLFTQKYVPEDNIDWKSNEEESIENVSLRQNLNLASAYGTPEFTNYTPIFSGCLDYIFYQTDNLKVQQIVPLPSKSELDLQTGLPSIVSPSDHISLCADLKWSK